MGENLSLFEPGSLPLKEHLGPKLKVLAESNLFLGTSSWKYEGWLGSLYSPERYSLRGRFSKSRFERECLAEYLEVFPIVSGDFSFYQFPTVASWKGLFTQVRRPFRFAFKAPQEITAPVVPRPERYGSGAGQLNPSFLHSDLFTTQFLQPLRRYLDFVAVIVFEFPASTAKVFTGSRFADALKRFLEQLPHDFRYAVEIRSPPLFCPEYLGALREHGVAHAFNSWTEMIPPGEQMSEQDAFTANFTVCRALTAPGRSYEESVSLFKPYSNIREPNAEVREALRRLLVRSKRRGEPTYIFVNNRLEGFSPGTIAAVIEQLDTDK
ncbi:MAG: DUF72 domain-containing protein [Bryobacteraceae bacterium]